MRTNPDDGEASGKKFAWRPMSAVSGRKGIEDAGVEVTAVVLELK